MAFSSPASFAARGPARRRPLTIAYPGQRLAVSRRPAHAGWGSRRRRGSRPAGCLPVARAPAAAERVPRGGAPAAIGLFWGPAWQRDCQHQSEDAMRRIAARSRTRAASYLALAALLL